MPKVIFGGNTLQPLYDENVSQPKAQNNIAPYSEAEAQPEDQENPGFFKSVENYFNENVLNPFKETVGSHLSQTAQHFSEIPGKFVEHAKGVPNDLRTLERGLKTTVPSLIEGAVSGPGTLAELALGAGNKYISEKIPTYETVQEKFPPLKLFPTTEQAHGVTKKLIGDKLEPETHREGLYDEIMRSIGMIAFNPVSIMKGLPNFAKGVGGVLAGKGAREAVRYYGGSPTMQAAADLGVSWMVTMPNIAKHLKKMETPAWNRVAASFEEGEKFRSNDIANALLSEAEIATKGLNTDAKDFIAKHIVGAAKKIKNKDGNLIFEKAKLTEKDLPDVIDHLKNLKKSDLFIDIDELVQIRKDVNEYLRSKATPYQATPFLMRTKEVLTDTAKEYGKKNSEFIEALHEAESITHGLKAKSEFNDFLQRNVSLKDTIKNDALKMLLVGGSGLAAGGKATALGLTGAKALKDVTKVTEMIARSKPLAKEWLNLMGSKGLPTVSSAAHSIKMLNKAADLALNVARGG